MAGQPVFFGTPNYNQLVDFWNAGHPTNQNQQQSAVAGELLWATPEQAAAYEAPPGKPVVLFIRGTKEAHVKSHDSRTGQPTTVILDYTERAPIDNSPYATKEQVEGLRADFQALIAALRGDQKEGVENEKQS